MTGSFARCRPAPADSSPRMRAPRRSSRRSAPSPPGQAQLDPSVQRRLLEALASGARLGVAEPAAPAPLDDGLTVRETEVLVEIAAGHSNAEIASRLFVSEATVKTHVNHLLAKTGCRDRAALVGYAYRTGRITP